MGALMQLQQLGPRSAGDRVRELPGLRLLAGQEQLGNWLGSRWIHHDVQEPKQQLRNRFPGALPNCLNEQEGRELYTDRLLVYIRYKYTSINNALLHFCFN